VIPTTKTWREIKGIGLTKIADGGTARTIQIENRAARLITARDENLIAVNGTALVTLQGY
jgi:hypothetical protein